MTQTVAETLDAHILRTEKPRPPDHKWHPSSLFSCERQSVYEMLGIDTSDKRESRSRRILFQGTALHEMVQKAMVEDSGANAVYNEVEVTQVPLNVTGHADTLLQFIDEDPYREWYELLEFKSIGANSLTWALKKKELPKADHIKQAKTYAMGLRLYGGRYDIPIDERSDSNDWRAIPPLGSKLKRIRWVYFSRDDLRIEEYVEEYDESWDQEFTGYIARLDEHVEEGTLPARLPLENGKKNWLCAGYCQYRTRCWGQDTEDSMK